MTDTNTLKITLVKSPNHRIQKHKACIKGLGLKKINDVVVRENTPENRGMVNQIKYLLHVEEQ
jgi:large subunit ribosomal protein L30